METDEKKVLETLFPGREVEVAPGLTIQVHPIWLEDLPRVIDKIEALISAKEKMAQESPEGKIDMLQFGTSCAKEIIALIPYSTDDLPPKKIPGTAGFPALFEAIIELNLNDYSMGKWKALADRIVTLIGGLGKLEGMIGASGQGLAEQLPQS